MARILFSFLMALLWAAPSTAGITFIVNANNTTSSLTISEIRDYYFKRKQHWPDGTQVRFVDRGHSSPIRQTFLSTILNKTAEDVDLFWIGQKLYTGNAAPLQQSSENLTIQFVAGLKGAIGYISDQKPLTSKGVKTIKVENASGD